MSISFVRETCCNCGIDFGVTQGFYDLCKADSTRYFSCPNGHRQHYTESETDRLRQERDRLKQNAAYLEDRNAALSEECDHQARRAAAMKGQVTRIKRRVSAGVCPCCNRTFQDLARHMSGQHPGFTAEEALVAK